MGELTERATKYLGMVWIKPKPGGGSAQDERKEWRTVIRNPYFKLQQQRDNQPLPEFVAKKHHSFDTRKSSAAASRSAAKPKAIAHALSQKNINEPSKKASTSKALAKLEAKSPPKSSFRILLLKQTPSKEGEAGYYIIAEEQRERTVQKEWEFIKTTILPKVRFRSYEISVLRLNISLGPADSKRERGGRS